MDFIFSTMAKETPFGAVMRTMIDNWLQTNPEDTTKPEVVYNDILGHLLLSIGHAPCENRPVWSHHNPHSVRRKIMLPQPRHSDGSDPTGRRPFRKTNCDRHLRRFHSPSRQAASSPKRSTPRPASGYPSRRGDRCPSDIGRGYEIEPDSTSGYSRGNLPATILNSSAFKPVSVGISQSKNRSSWMA